MIPPKLIFFVRRSVFLLALSIAAVFLLELIALTIPMFTRNAVAAPRLPGPTAPGHPPAAVTTSLTINGVRVTLAYVGHETTFRENVSGRSQPVRCLVIGYTEESLHPEPVNKWNEGPLRIVANGQPDEVIEQYWMTEPPGTFSGGPSKIGVADRAHATAERIWLQDDKLPSGALAEIIINLGPNDQNEEFHFTAVPIP